MTTNQTIDGTKLRVTLTAEQFVKGYCERSGISLSEFYEAMVPMPEARSPSGWAAVSNNPLCVKAHIELHSPSPSGPVAVVMPGAADHKSEDPDNPAYFEEPCFADGWNSCPDEVNRLNKKKP